MRFLPVFLLFFLASFGQELPPVTNFSPQEYAAGNQNWMLSQGEDKRVYIANNSGLLEYNGEQWSLYHLPDGSFVRSVHASGKKVYSGAYMDFGYWTRNAVGGLDYKSLKDSVKVDILDGEQFWHIKELDDYVLFQSHRRIYSYNKSTGKISTIVTENNISNLFRVGNKIYYQVADKGLFLIENGQGKLFFSNQQIGGKNIIGLFPFSDEEILAVTRDNGLFTINGNHWIAYPLENYPLSSSFFTALYTEDGTLALGSIGDGFYILDLRNSEKYHLSQPAIINNTVLAIMEDRAGNLWGALDNGLTVVNKESPFRLFMDTFGDIGTVYCSYKLGDIIYLGTNQGLYYRRSGSDGAYQFIPGTSGQVWSINYVDGKLYVGHDRGTFLVKGTTAVQIWDGLGTWVVKKLGDGILQGHYNGLTYMGQEDPAQSFHYLKNFELSSRNIVVEKDTVIWVTHYHKGIFRLTLSKDFSEVEKTKHYEVSYQSSPGLQMFSYNDSIYYSTQCGIYKYLPEKDSFTTKNELNRLSRNEDRITGISEVLKDGTWWTFGKDNLYYVVRDNLESKLIRRSVPLPLEYRNIANGFENISLVGDNKYMIGSNMGYVTFGLPLQKISMAALNISGVETATKGGEFSPKPLDSELHLENDVNYINFRFTIPYYGKLSSTKYSYRLLGYSSDWSKWDATGMAPFKNLPAGNYDFQVKGKYHDQVTDVVSHKFSIAKPWYFSSLALVFYGFLFVLLAMAIHYTYKRYHNKILREKERNLKLQNLEAEQKIVKLQNEHLERDMADKNRQLAASTMSIVKKNEFLTNIKEKLRESNSSNVKGVIRTIDKEISEEDNWNMFKEAFQNADKDFFNKIKRLHPDLTSNDLRLCAYLRLNLSSKEIAPLINISVKSVEIKRYRLRKKMNLPRETNLTDYIMEI